MIWQRLRRFLAARPNGARASIRTSEVARRVKKTVDLLGSEITITIPRQLRSRIEIAAIRRQTTVTEMLEDLLAREFPADTGRAL